MAAHAFAMLRLASDHSNDATGATPVVDGSHG
jgi:hypothetical protein